jgi:hypothetical protein
MATSKESLSGTYEGRTIDGGPITIMLDHRSDDGDNLGAAEFSGEFRTRMAIQVTAPGLVDIMNDFDLEPLAVGPVRAICTWEGQRTAEGEVEASGTVEVRPGTVFEGTTARSICAGT